MYYLKGGKRADAAKDADTAVKLDPNQAHVHIVRANVRMKNGEFDLALADLAEAGRIEPDSSVVHALRSVVLAKKGQVGKAIGEMARNPCPFRGRRSRPGVASEPDDQRLHCHLPPH
jgi:Tfp pilus assembly protein PilF